ncbi:acyl-CoA dehydrogenase family protein [Telluria mixta]|uniref:Acyl-CoA dehydrogenase family protein n=1 Tax=Telluria mixta TaxID=34071 RepID=A0ABT2C5B7_9BURK|nr:acyl-CoA dehydrogenase family protein [Telluria mixta]MCS0632026.1 acyl-CoA dehydrogenase family protein [Telluria mixta]WEM95297.1 acyl-CoA dehydrogenase family protein [Telluria mixta]
MDFNFKEEQLQLADALKRWIARDYTFEARRAIVGAPAGVSGTAWATLAELGLTALPLPEALGGFDGDAVDMFVVMQELGRGLVVEPYFATMFGAEFLRRGRAHDALLERVAVGELKLACALGERQSRHDLRDVATRATPAAPDGDGWRLNGEKKVVLHGAQAGVLIVSARTAGAQRDEDGITLFAVPADAAGVVTRDVRMLDGQRAADVLLRDVKVGADAVIGVVGAGWTILEAAADYGAGLLCAEALGAMDALFAATLDYLKTRQQFGVPIGKFQALQHRMADMYVHLEQARSMALLAAVRLAGDVGGDQAAERRRAVAAAKYRVGQAARFVGQQAIQLHGGMGVTDELPASHYFKRLSTIELTLGDCDHHLARFIAQPGFYDDEEAA